MSHRIKRAFFDTEDGQILYRIGGEGEPILLLHMTPRSSDEFKELMPMLAEKKLVIAMDLMGLGDSDKPPRVYSVADYAKNAIALLDELGIKKTSIFGSLTGGYIAGEFAAAYPERVDKLILCNVFGFDTEEQDKIHKRYSQGYQVKEDGSHLMAQWLARVNYIGNGELNHRCVLDDLKCFGSPIYPGLAVANYCLAAKERFRLIKCPTLVLLGEKALEPLEKVGLAKPENQSWLQEIIPHGQSVELESGTMWMVNQMPEEVLKVVVDFLDKQ
ncbi:alpha/beta hydrolase [Nostoc sp. FACHB-152]|uniref:alpha/beta fold hydrolase n=1 Tax=unclassified Nostoc TaxID=2593658 RepID=UPI00168421D9|nr:MULTISPECIES: alpha/beta hydrolase [unclassified Nostoc]MBD2450333.1 alpha/beta hydrolase [Nostoc sp. FACHB-152]MBD2471763.1 alpha/beta hydrolase [Nostoc sp. FACHB-145]